MTTISEETKQEAQVEAAGKETWGSKAKRAFADLGVAAQWQRITAELSTVRSQVVKSVAEVQERVEEFKGKLDPKPAVAKVREVLKFDVLKARVLEHDSVSKASQSAKKALQDGVELTHETIEKLGLARIGDLNGLAKITEIKGLSEAFEALAKKVDALKKKVDGLSKAGKPESEATSE